jgi:hypothetical protein
MLPGVAMFGDLVLELFPQHPYDCLNVHSVADRRKRLQILLTVDPSVKLVSTPWPLSPSVWPSAPDNDAPRSNTAIPDMLVGFVVEPGKLIGNEIVWDLPAVVLFDQAQPRSTPGLVFTSDVHTRR